MNHIAPLFASSSYCCLLEDLWKKYYPYTQPKRSRQIFLSEIKAKKNTPGFILDLEKYILYEGIKDFSRFDNLKNWSVGIIYPALYKIISGVCLRGSCKQGWIGTAYCKGSQQYQTVDLRTNWLEQVDYNGGRIKWFWLIRAYPIMKRFNSQSFEELKK